MVANLTAAQTIPEGERNADMRSLLQVDALLAAAAGALPVLRRSGGLEGGGDDGAQQVALLKYLSAWDIGAAPPARPELDNFRLLPQARLPAPALQPSARK